MGKKYIKLKDVIKFFNFTSAVEIFQIDTSIEYKKDDGEIVFTGHILDIPWYLLDYYLVKDSENDEPITTFVNDKSQACFYINVASSKAAVKKRKKEIKKMYKKIRKSIIER